MENVFEQQQSCITAAGAPFCLTTDVDSLSLFVSHRPFTAVVWYKRWQVNDQWNFT